MVRVFMYPLGDRIARGLVKGEAVFEAGRRQDGG